MTTNLIDYIIKNKGLRQKDIAENLNVSKAQVSKWKSGEHIPHERREKLLSMAGLFGYDSEWAILVGSESNSERWISYMAHMNEIVDDNVCSFELEDEPEIYSPIILTALVEQGLKLPKTAPNISDMEKDEYRFTDFDNFIHDYLTCYGPMIEWSRVYLLSEDDELFDHFGNITAHSIDLALRYVSDKNLEKVGFDLSDLNSRLSEIDRKARIEISALCTNMQNLKIPFKTDYFDIVNNHPYEIDDNLLHSTASIYSPLPNVAMRDFLSYGEQLILAETRANRLILEDIDKKLEKLLQSK